MQTMETLLNVAYLRCSTEDQDVTHQLESIHKFCYNNGITIDKTVKDEGVSAYNKSAYERKGFSEIVELTQQNKINKLILFESSRLSRNFYEGQNLIKFFSDHRVEVYSVVDGGIINATELDNLLNSIRYWINQKASKETSDRIKSQKKMASDRGEYLGHPVLLGFKIENKREIIDEAMAPFVIKLFDTYIQHGTKECIPLLKSIGISATHQTLLQRLRNKKYKTLVGEDKFEITQRFIKSRRCFSGANTIALNRSKIRYEGLLYHSCGNKLAIDKNRKGEPYFRCKKCKGDKSISIKKSFTGNKLMANIDIELNKIIQQLNEEELQKRYNKKSYAKMEVINSKINELKHLISNKQKALNSANKKLEKLLAADEANMLLITTVANTIDSMKKDLEPIELNLLKEQNEYDTLNEESKSNEQSIQKTMDLKKRYLLTPQEQQKFILSSMIKKVIVYDTDLFDIYLNI